jgi:hypothetical protein
MNKKVLIIGGGVVVLGAIGYLYFTNKKKQEAILSGGTSEAGSTSATPTTGTPTTGVGASPINSEIPPLSTGGIVTSATKAPTIQGQEDLDKANDIVVKLKDYYQKSAFQQARVNSYKPSSMSFSFMKPSNPYPIMIKKLKDDLLKLGYEYKGEKDGVLVKL